MYSYDISGPTLPRDTSLTEPPGSAHPEHTGSQNPATIFMPNTKRLPTEGLDMQHTGHASSLAREARAIVALALRNGPIEDIHAGKPCPLCHGRRGYSRITDAEMKRIIKNAVDNLYRLLRLKESDPTKYRSMIDFGSQYTAAWDDPVGDKFTRP